MRYSPERFHAVEHGLGSGIRELVDDAAVGQEPGVVGVAGGDRVVGDHDHCLAQLVDRLADEGEDLGAGAESRLPVGSSAKIDLRPAGQCPGHRDPLLLAA